MLKLIAFYFILAGVLFGLSYTSLVTWMHPDVKFIWAFFFFQAYLSQLLHQIGSNNDRENFVQFHMASQAVRFITSLIFIGVFAYFKTPEIYLFVGNFFVLYLCSTNFEIISLLRNLRRF
ncbi:hypothetical protein V7S76_04555 [Aquirufa sp. ROCK2-A2]